MKGSRASRVSALTLQSSLKFAAHCSHQRSSQWDIAGARFVVLLPLQRGLVHLRK